MKRGATLAAVIILPTLIAAGCRDSFKDCENTATCETEGDGDLGGGGGDGDGDTGGTGGGGPCASCTGATPACNEAEECVQCTPEDSSACVGDTSVCDGENEVCVGCLTAGDCPADAPVCDNNECKSCTESTDCAEHPATPVCDDVSGGCVGCLDESDCEGKVCAPQTNTCTDLDAGALFACQECVHDAQCQEGQLCVEQEFDSEVVGNFCTWTKQARVGDEVSCFSAGKPFAGQTAEPVTSTDGASAVLCVLRSTTCPAFLQHSQTVAGCEDETPTSDAACGAPDLDDGQCRENTGGDPLCTYPCIGPEDCSGASTCNGAPDGYCAL